MMSSSPSTPSAKRRKIQQSIESAFGPSKSGVAALVTEKVCNLELATENIQLKKKLAALEQKLQEQKDAARPSTSKTVQSAAEAAGEELVYMPEDHAAFLRKFRKARAVKRLDLSRLQRTTASFPGGRSGGGLLALFFHKPRPFQKSNWRPDKKVDAVLAALLSSTENVEELVLGDAKWATENKYAAEMLKVLRRFKKSVSTLSITSRALLQTSANGYCKVNNIDVIGAMPSLSTLQLDVVPVSNHYNAYAGEFDPTRGSWGRADKKTRPFTKLRSVRLHLTKDWFESQFGAVDAICDDDDYDNHFESVGGGCGEEEHDEQTVDLLQHRGDLITHLDMAAFRPTRVHLPIVDLLAGLKQLRSIVLRAEMLGDVVRDMRHLEEVELLLLGTATKDSLQAVADEIAQSSSLKGLLRLKLRVLGTEAADFRVSVVLAAAALHLTRLRSLELDGVNSWRPEDISAAVITEDGSLRPLETLLLSRCGPMSLQGYHLPLLSALPNLRHLSLPRHLQAEAGALARPPQLKVSWE